MPYSPPCCNHNHTSVCHPVRMICRENIRVHKQNESQARVLDTSLYCQGSSVFVREFHQCAGSKSNAECKKIVYKHNNEYRCDTVKESIEITSEDNNYHCYENNDRKALKRFFQFLCNSWIVLCAEHSQYEWNTHYYDYALKNFPERNLQCMEFSNVVVGNVVKIHLSPECKIDRGSNDACCCIECRQRNRQFRITS